MNCLVLSLISTCFACLYAKQRVECLLVKIEMNKTNSVKRVSSTKALLLRIDLIILQSLSEFLRWRRQNPESVFYNKL